MKSFLEELLKNYDGKKVMIIGHRATQYGLEHWIKGLSGRNNLNSLEVATRLGLSIRKVRFGKNTGGYPF